VGASCVSKLKLPLLRVLTLFSLPVPGSVVHPPPPLAISTPGWMQAWRQQISPLKEEVPSVNDGDPDMSNGNFWGQFSLVDSVTLETEAGYTVCLKGLPTRTRRLSILEKACPDPASPDFNVRLLSGCIMMPPMVAVCTLLHQHLPWTLGPTPCCRCYPVACQPLNSDEYTKYSKLVGERSEAALEEASKEGPARAVFKKSRVGIPTVSQHLHLAPCLEVGYADEPGTYMADVVLAFSTREAHDDAARVRRRKEVRQRPPLYLFVHWHQTAHTIGGPLALPCTVTFLGADYSIIRADDPDQLRLRRAVKVIPQLDSLGGVVLPSSPDGEGGQAASAGAGRAGAGRSKSRQPSAAIRQPVVELRREPTGPRTGPVTISITRRYALCYHPTLYVG
jgi:hypothetical protein